MKTISKLLLSLCLGAAALCAVSCAGYDDSELRTDIADLQSRLGTLEQKVNDANGEITSIWTIVNALNHKETITSVTETTDGWVIEFTGGKTVTVYKKQEFNIGVKKGSDGNYYWTVGGEWLTDADGKMVPATGVAPQLKIEDGDWYISTDGGTSWTNLGRATGEQGAPGEKGDSMFQWVDWDESFVYFALANGEILRIGRGAGGVQTITAVPGYSDGSVKAYKSVFQISFDVLPKEAAPKLAAESTDIFELKVVYTSLTKAAAGEALTLPVTGKEGTADGVLTLTVDGSALADEFVAETLGASACLNVVFNENAVTSGYFQLKKDPYNNHEFVDLGLPSGLKWATCNVGATKPEEYGEYFAWGETEPKKEYSWLNYKFELGTDYNGPFSKYVTNSSYGTVDNKTVLDPEDDAAHVNWGGSWRMPTDAEWTELKAKCTWTWTIQNGVNGRLVTGPNGKSIFLPVAGHRDGTSLYEAGSYGDYWSLSLNTYYPFFAYGFYFDSYYVSWNNYFRCNGLSVRPVYGEFIPGEFIPVASISLDKTSLELNVEDKQQLTATVSPSNATAKEVLWESSDIFIATVDQTGLVTAVAPGTATITAYGSSGVSASCTVTIKKKAVEPEYVDLGLPSGTKWATFNVGATKPEEYGDYFAWGETEPKSNYDWSTYKWCNGSETTQTKYNTSSSYGTVDNKTVLDPEDDAAHVNWGGSWRMPTYAEWTELRTNCTWTWTSQNGVNGRLVTGPNGKSIFLPATGYRYDTDLNSAGSYGNYWSSSLYTDAPDKAYSALFNSDAVGWGDRYRLYGFSVRPVTE